MRTPIAHPLRVARRAVAALLACLSLGCASPPPQDVPPVVAECMPPGGVGRPGPALVGQTYGTQMTPIPLDSIQFDSSPTSARVAVQQMYASRTPTGTVAVQVRFLSCADVSSRIRVRTSFMRSDGMPVEPPSAWKTVHLTPRALGLYSETSIGREIGHYLVEVASQ